ncbi:MAG TPA: hypothetical protein VMN57_03225 [Anaerolineales bacterium]|nr:hypothetical protein [Anaerolineales bacterium]
MPRLSVVFIRTSLLHLVLGFTLGALILVQKGVGVFPSAWRLLPAHIEVLFFGWTVQLIMGTAYWILPRFPTHPVRGNEAPVRLAYTLLNAGVLAAALGPFLTPSPWTLLAGRLAEVLAIIAFVSNAWPRVKPFGR